MPHATVLPPDLDRPERVRSSEVTWGQILTGFAKGVAWVLILALLFRWGWGLVLPVVRQYADNPPALTFGRIFGAMLMFRTFRLAGWGGLSVPRMEVKIVK